MCIVAISFIIRYWVCCEIYQSTNLSSAPQTGTDMQTYKLLSEEIYKRNFNKVFYYQPFYYAVFLPSVYMIAGLGIWGIIVFQCIAGSLTVLLTGLSAAYIRNRRTGIIVALLVCFSLMSTFYTAFLLIATLKAFLISLLLFATVIATRKDKWYYWLLTGFICACLTLTRANAVLFLPLLMLVSYLTKRKKIKTPPHAPFTAFFIKLIPSLLILMLFILPQIPFIIHNSSIKGKLTPPSTAGSANLAIGNNPEACPAGLSYPQTSTYWAKHSKEISVPKRIIIWFRTSPLAVIELTFRKLLVFCDAGTVFDNIKGFRKIRQDSKLLNFLPFIPTSLYLIGFIAAVIILGKRIITHKELLFPFAMVILYWLATAAFINLSRYRLAVLPLLALFTAILIDKLIINSKKSGKLLKPILLIILAFIFVYGAYPLYRFVLEKRIFSMIQPNGNQITLGTEKHYLDNGPFNMGFWTPFPFMKNTKIIKEFKINPKDVGKNAEFHITLLCLENKAMQININGKPFTSIPSKKNMVFKFRIKVPKDGKITIEPKILKTGTVYANIDLQRDFARTSVNNQKLDGELVARLIVKRTE